MKVAIVGGAPTSDYLAPFDDPEWQIWVLGNQMDRHLNRKVDRIFEVHDNLSEHDPNYPQWLVDLNIPLTVSDKFPVEADHVEVYPKQAAIKIMGDGYFSSSPAYMMAYAILSGATHIGIYGVDMSVNDHEYFKQRPAMYAWMAYARAKGIEITIPKESSLCNDTYDEGTDWGNGAKTPFSSDEFQIMIDKHKEQQDHHKTLIQVHGGCIQAYTHMQKIARAVESGQNVKSISKSLKIVEAQ